MRRDARDAGQAIIVIRGLSIYSFIVAMEYFAYRFPNIFSYYNFGKKMAILPGLAPTICLIILGLILWVLSPMIAARIFKSVEPKEKYGLTAYDIQVVAFSAVGLFVLVNTLPVFLDTLILEFAAGPYAGDNKFMTVRGYSHIITLMVKIAFGVWLVIGSGGIVKFVRSFRQGEADEA